MADPSYNNVVRAAQFIKAPVALVALTSDYRHDVKAMLAVAQATDGTGSMFDR